MIVALNHRVPLYFVVKPFNFVSKKPLSCQKRTIARHVYAEQWLFIRLLAIHNRPPLFSRISHEFHRSSYLWLFSFSKLTVGNYYLKQYEKQENTTLQNIFKIQSEIGRNKQTNKIPTLRTISFFNFEEIYIFDSVPIRQCLCNYFSFFLVIIKILLINI